MVIIAWLRQSGGERDRVVISAPDEENSRLGIQRLTRRARIQIANSTIERKGSAPRSCSRSNLK